MPQISSLNIEFILSEPPAHYLFCVLFGVHCDSVERSGHTLCTGFGSLYTECTFCKHVSMLQGSCRHVYYETVQNIRQFKRSVRFYRQLSGLRSNVVICWASAELVILVILTTPPQFCQNSDFHDSHRKRKNPQRYFSWGKEGLVVLDCVTFSVMFPVSNLSLGA